MEKPLIGVVAPRYAGEKNRIFQDSTRFFNLVSNRIYEAGGIPAGVLFPNNTYQNDILNNYDGFVLQGGSVIESTQVNVVHHAIMHDKPILGICAGMQTIAAYEFIRKMLGNNISPKMIEKYFQEYFSKLFLKKVSNHNKLDPFYINRIEESKHRVILEDSQIKDLFKESVINMPSVHNYAVRYSIFANSDMFKVVGRSEDGVIECIESKNNIIIGVQFHPELEVENIHLFENTVDEARLVRKRKQ